MTSLLTSVANIKRNETYVNIVNGGSLNLYTVVGGALTTYNAASATNYILNDIGVVTGAYTYTDAAFNNVTGRLTSTLNPTLAGLKPGVAVSYNATTYYVLTNTGTYCTLSATLNGPSLVLGAPVTASTLTVAANPVVGGLKVRSTGKTILTPAQSYNITSGGLTNQAILKKVVVDTNVSNATMGDGDAPNSGAIYINLLDGGFASV